MRAAPPPVEFALGSGRRERFVVALLYAAAAAGFVAWLASRAELGASIWLVWLVLGSALASACVGWSLMAPLRGRLSWDGTSWSHLPAAESARQPLQAVYLQIDLGHWLLLRVPRPGHKPSSWCAVTAAELGAAWHGARLALYYRPPHRALPVVSR